MEDVGPYAMMTCPYNKSHQIQQYRMHVHLQKCRKQYPNSNKTTCPFDATHVVNDVELDYHIKTCSMRSLFDNQAYVVDDEFQPPEPLPPPVVPSEENWEDDNVTSYKPDPSKKGSHIILKAKGLTPSERRKVRMEGVRSYRPAE